MSELKTEKKSLIEEKYNLKLIEITPRVTRKILVAINKLDLRNVLENLLFRNSLYRPVTWADLRASQDWTLDELKENQIKYNHNVLFAALSLEKLTGEVIVSQDIMSVTDIYNQVMDNVILDDDKWEIFVDTVAMLYNTTSDIIEDIPLTELMEEFKSAIEDEDFQQALPSQ